MIARLGRTRRGGRSGTGRICRAFFVACWLIPWGSQAQEAAPPPRAKSLLAEEAGAVSWSQAVDWAEQGHWLAPFLQLAAADKDGLPGALYDASGLEETQAFGLGTMQLSARITRSRIVAVPDSPAPQALGWRLLDPETDASEWLHYAPADTVLFAGLSIRGEPLWEQLHAFFPQLDRGGEPPGWGTVIRQLKRLAVVITQHPTRTRRWGTPETYSTIPEAGLLVIAETQGEALYRFLAETLRAWGRVHTEPYEAFELTILPIFLPTPMPLRPTIAYRDGLLLLGTTQDLVQLAITTAKTAKGGVRGDETFQGLTKNLPTCLPALLYTDERLAGIWKGGGQIFQQSVLTDLYDAGFTSSSSLAYVEPFDELWRATILGRQPFPDGTVPIIDAIRTGVESQQAAVAEVAIEPLLRTLSTATVVCAMDHEHVMPEHLQMVVDEGYLRDPTVLTSLQAKGLRFVGAGLSLIDHDPEVAVLAYVPAADAGFHILLLDGTVVHAKSEPRQVGEHWEVSSE